MAASEVRETSRTLEQMRLQLARFNAALGTANGLRMSLENDATALETRINSVLKVGGSLACDYIRVVCVSVFWSVECTWSVGW